MSTLVIRLGRLGDVIQTTPLLLQLAAQQPGQRLDLLIVGPNQQCLSGLSGLTSVYTVSEELKPLDDRIAAGFRKRQIPPAAWACLRNLELPHYDRVINASHAALGCWLAGEISCAVREGGVINRQGECLYDGGAHAYRVAMLGFRRQNWFNVIDLLRCAGPPGTRHTSPKLYVATARELPFVLPLLPAPNRYRIALNVGANEKHRCWPPQHFAQLAAALHEFGCSPILVGAPSDRDACAEVEALSRVPLPNFAGQTSIPEMARLLKKCDLLISSDTGAVHIAAAVGTNVLGLYGASAYFAETGPWGPGPLDSANAAGRPAFRSDTGTGFVSGSQSTWSAQGSRFSTRAAARQSVLLGDSFVACRSRWFGRGDLSPLTCEFMQRRRVVHSGAAPLVRATLDRKKGPS
jgi:heptosyltransferase I